MNPQAHWDKIYTEKSPDMVSWYRPHLETSLALIERVGSKDSAIIDVGGGESTLVDDLLEHGYRTVTVLDISKTAIDVTRKRLGAAAERVNWVVGNIAEVELEMAGFDVWHDRAAFHFLTTLSDRAAYVRQVGHSVRQGGYVIVSTFGPEGPTKCSGLDIVRYDTEMLHAEFGIHFRLLESCTELHRTPFDTTQQFLYCLCRVE